MKTPATVLIVEDDRALRLTLIATLKAAGYAPVPAVNAAEGRRWFAHYAPDLVLLDLGLPDGDGLDLIVHIRKRGQTPVVVLSARDAQGVKVEALDRGADDYVAKPFGVDELLARLRAALRHGVQARGSAPVVVAGPLRIDMGLRRVTVENAVVELSPKQYEILCALALQLDRPVAHADLLRQVWRDERADIQYLRVFVGQLRARLGEAASLLVTAPGVGYRLAAHPEAR